jgi:hypothetical protein
MDVASVALISRLLYDHHIGITEGRIKKHDVWVTYKNMTFIVEVMKICKFIQNYERSTYTKHPLPFKVPSNKKPEQSGKENGKKFMQVFVCVCVCVKVRCETYFRNNS